MQKSGKNSHLVLILPIINMTKKTRLIVLILCVILFFVLAPYIILYSLGYRVDFEKQKIVATGGIYVRTFPSADQITIDSKISDKPGMFSGSVFVQSLIPKSHSVLIQKAGYFDYYKTLPVEENEVTKLENVLLFKKDISYAVVADPEASPFLPATQEGKFYLKNNNLYSLPAPSASPAPTTSPLPAGRPAPALPVIKNVVAFQTSGQNIFWLGTDGFFYKSGATGKNPEKLTTTKLEISKNGVYKIITAGQNIFLNNNGRFLLLNSKIKDFETFAKSVTDAKVSPNGKNLIYFAGKEIFIFPLNGLAKKGVLLYQSPADITNVLWLNNDYVIFSLGRSPSTGEAAGSQILISEIDYRGNVNTITLPSKEFVNPKIYFNQQDGKLYILSGANLFASEKLVP